MEKPVKYSLKVQAIRPKGQTPKLYVYFPLPLAAAIGLQPGEEVEWELLDSRGIALGAPPRAPTAHSEDHQFNALNIFNTLSAAAPRHPLHASPINRACHGNFQPASKFRYEISGQAAVAFAQA